MKLHDAVVTPVSSSIAHDWTRLSPTSNLFACRVRPPAGAPLERAALYPTGAPSECAVYILSADHGIAWNPFMRRNPRERPEWIFATPGTPQFVSEELASGFAVTAHESKGRICILHSESSRSQSALMEMADELTARGARTLVLITGGSLFEAAAATVAKLSQLFGWHTHPEKTTVVIVPSAQPPSTEFERVEDHYFRGGEGSSTQILATQIAYEYAALSVVDRLRLELKKTWENGYEIADSLDVIGTREISLEDLIASKGGDSDEASPRIDLDYRVIVLMGTIGTVLRSEAKKLAAQLFADGENPRAVHVVTEREAARVRAGIESTRASLIQKLKRGERLIVAAPNPRRSDRDVFARLARTALSECPAIDEANDSSSGGDDLQSGNEADRSALVAWITKPGYWENTHDPVLPEPSIAFFANSVQFESPDLDDSIPYIRLV